MTLLKILFPCCFIVAALASKPHNYAEVLLKDAGIENCYCVPPNSPGVRAMDMLNIDSTQKERLVVYLYKNNHDQITAFIPNHDKQIVLPELVLDIKDKLERNVTGDIATLFISNLAYKLPIDEHVNNVNVAQNELHETKIKLPNWKVIAQEHTIGEDNYENIDELSIVPQQIEKNNHKNPVESDKKFKIFKSDLLLKPIYKKNNNGLNPNSGGGVNQNQRKNIQNLNPNFFSPWWHIENLPSTDHKTFDHWLLLQGNSLLKHKSFKDFILDMNALKVALVKILHENGIIISDNGSLNDAYGNTYKLESLRLNPILLGSPLVYEKLIENNDCIAPDDLPYIQAVLVSLDGRARVLGIITLGNLQTTNKKLPCSHRKVNVQHEYTNSPKSIGAYDSGQNFDSDNVIFVEDLNSKTFFEPVQFVELKNTETLNEDFSSEQIVSDYQDIGIKILGGQAATSSGTPLNIKGRSVQ